MKQSKIDALDKLGLTKEEALEWIERLARNDRISHKDSRIATNYIVCYKDENGKYSYHRYIDPFRINEIYAVQVMPDWLMTLHDETEKYVDFSIAIDIHWKAQYYDKYAKANGWEVMTLDFLKEYQEEYARFLASDDAALLKKNKVKIKDLSYGYDYWVREDKELYTGEHYSLYNLFKTDASLSDHDAKRGYIRLIKSVKSLPYSD